MTARIYIVLSVLSLLTAIILLCAGKSVGNMTVFAVLWTIGASLHDRLDSIERRMDRE